MDILATRVVRRILRAAESESGKATPKRMVIMIGPPAAGKGFFLGEPEKWDESDAKKGKIKPDQVGKPKTYKGTDGKERETHYGYKLPQMLVDDEGKSLMTDDDVPANPDYDESDNHLRSLQRAWAERQYETLAAAHKKGKEAFSKALADQWYQTKDGSKVELGKLQKDSQPLVSFDNFPKDANGFFKTANKDFFVSMRGWHDDATKYNHETGKPVERFKDQARHHFDDNVKHYTMDEAQSGFQIVDSAGEDIDAQDFKGQIDDAKAHGFEVTVVFLHPEKADTELSNLARNRVQGKRMVDQSDIDNWYEKNKDALKAIQAASPDNFVHYRKPPPDPDPKKAAEMRSEARKLMERLKDVPKDSDERKEMVKTITGTLYGKNYKMERATSYGKLGSLPKKPEKNIAEAVEAMNHEASKRAGEETKPASSKSQKKPRTRTQFLEEVGDKTVPNPNPDGRKDHVKIRSLDWKDQKKYYKKWRKQANLTERVVARWKESVMKSAAAPDKESWLTKWMNELASTIKEDLEVEGYPDIEVTALKGPVVLVTIKGAAEDTTAAKDAHEQIDEMMTATTKTRVTDWADFRNSIRSMSKGDDLVIKCEIIFP